MKRKQHIIKKQEHEKTKNKTRRRPSNKIKLTIQKKNTKKNQKRKKGVIKNLKQVYGNM